MKLKALFMSSAVLALVVFAAPGYAFDAKTAPGSYCKPSPSSAAYDYYYGGSSINNGGSSSKFVVCPILRDRQNPESIEMFVTVRSNGVDSVTCRLFSYDVNGIAAFISNEQASNQSTPVHLSFNLTDAQTPAQGTLEIRCELPPNSALINYVVGEFGETGTE